MAAVDQRPADKSQSIAIEVHSGAVAGSGASAFDRLVAHLDGREPGERGAVVGAEVVRDRGDVLAAFDEPVLSVSTEQSDHTRPGIVMIPQSSPTAVCAGLPPVGRATSAREATALRRCGSGLGGVRVHQAGVIWPRFTE